MTTLSNVYDIYNTLQIYLNKLNQKSDNHEIEQAADAVCAAMCDLETALAYIPIEEQSDRKIKLKMLKQTITALAEDNNGEIHLDQLTPRDREQLAMTLQLIKE